MAAKDTQAPDIWSSAVGVHWCSSLQLTPTSLLVLPPDLRDALHTCSPALACLAAGPSPCCRRLQAHAKVPEDAWEYQIRKALNDAAYNGLDYVPYSSTMPVQPKDDSPKWMWKKKGAK